jgi:hypothetical protein
VVDTHNVAKEVKGARSEAKRRKFVCENLLLTALGGLSPLSDFVEELL